MTSDPRLPRDLVPHHYDLTIEPDLDTCTFTGRVVIEAELVGRVSTIVCNAAELTVDRAHLHLDDGTGVTCTATIDEERERLHLDPGRPVGPGPVRLEIDYHGTINDRLRGFYRSTFTDDDGAEHVLATTQFQSTDARRAFPCWDEPDRKATFTVTLVVPGDLMAVANTAEVESRALPDGRRLVRFARTMPMSTYLVAFVVGPLEATAPVDVDGVPLRVVHRPGRADQTAFALEVGAHALRWFSAYYDIPYPSDKVDLVAVPDFAFGAMENLGCVTFREVLVLVDPRRASRSELQAVTDVIDHELAHMWFGDLVTMRWWEGIWLNEAFATFMETACTDAFRPDWDVWTSFCRARAAAFAVDGLANTRPIEYPVVTPADAEDMFDVLTYDKGASVVRMLERYLGAEPFRDGVRHYLRRHAHANTDTDDLWSDIGEVTGQPVADLMRGWIHQGGHPLIELVTTPAGPVARQSHFTYDPAAADERRWMVPLRLVVTGPGAPREEIHLLLEGPETSLPVDVERIVSANADSSGFYRVVPTAAMLDAVPRRPGDPSPLRAGERHALVDDTWALTRAGRLTAADALATAERFTAEDDLTVWQALAALLAGLDRLVDGDARAALQEHIGRLVRPALERVGVEPHPDDDDRTRERRATLVRVLGTLADDPAIIDVCRDLLDHDDVTLGAAALTVVAHHGDADTFARIRERYRTARDPQTEQRHLRALADFPDPDLVGTILAATLDGEVRSQDGPYLIRRALTNRWTGETAWRFVARHWDRLVARFPSNSIARMLEGIGALDRPALADEVAAFLAAHPVPQGDKQIAQHLETQRIAVDLRRRQAAAFAAHLLDHDRGSR